MLRLIVKLALAALIANAAWRIGSEYVSHFRFREAVRVATMEAGRDDERLRAAITAEAQRYGVPIAGADVRIDRHERRIGVEGSYRKVIEVAPGYEYPWTFDWAVEVFVAPSLDQTQPR